MVVGVLVGVGEVRGSDIELLKTTGIYSSVL
jgi:hypothetical protein